MPVSSIVVAMVGVNADWDVPDVVAILGVAIPIANPGVIGHLLASLAFGVVVIPGEAKDEDSVSAKGMLIWPGALLRFKLPVPSGLRDFR